MSPSLLRAALAALLVCTLLVLWHVWPAKPAHEPSADTLPTWEASAPQEPEIETANAATVFDSATRSPAPHPARLAPAPDAPLPPDDVAVDQVIAALDARARAGEARAACRVGSELQRCLKMQYWDESRWLSQAAQTELGPDTGEAMFAELDRLLARGAQLREACARVAPQVRRELPRYHLVAALGGNIHSAAQFATGIAIDPGDLVRDPQLYALYRAHAWPLFLQAFEAGHPDVLLAWAQASRGNHMLGGVLPEEWRKPEVAQTLAQRVVFRDPRSPAIQPQQLSPEQAAEVEDLYRQRFEQGRWEPQYVPPQTQPWDPQRYLLDQVEEQIRLKPCESSSG